WQMPVFDPPAETTLHTAAELDEIAAAAYQEGLQRGREQGYADGRQLAAQEAERLRELFAQLQRPMAQLDEDVERALLETACAIARRLVHDELRQAPESIEAIVRGALSALPDHVRELRVLAHPDDVALLQEYRDVLEPERRLQLVADASIARGGCQLRSDTTQIDASIEARLDAIR